MALTDLTRISTSGIATGSTIDSPILRKDVSLRGSQVGVTSALFNSSDDALEFNDNVKIKVGTHEDIEIYNKGNLSIIANKASGASSNNNPLHIFSHFDITHGSGFSQYFRVGNLVGQESAGAGNSALNLISGGAVEAFFDGTKRFETVSTGAVVTGILTATSFSGPMVGNINNPSGISTFYDLRVTNNLTVEGTTTTLDTNLIGVDRVEVGANSNSVVGVAITQSGTADIVNLFDGTTEVLTVKDGGKVGIGTDNPQAPLHIFDDLDATLRLESSDNGAVYHSLFRDNAGTKTRIGYMGFGGTGGTLNITNEVPNGNIFLSVTPSGASAGAEETAFRIHSDKKAEVYGDLQIPDKIIHTSDPNTAIRFPTADTITFETNGIERLRIGSNGYVGVGSDNPQADFEVFGYSSAASGAAPILAIRNGYSGTVNASNALKSELRFLHKNHNAAHEFMATRIMAETTDNYMQRTFLRFFVANANNGTERLTINPYGRVGINSTSPSNTLVIREETDNNPSIQLFRPSTGGDIANINWATNQGNQASINYRGAAGAGEGLQFYTGGTGSSNLRAIIDTSGKVGIGTDDPDQELSIWSSSPAIKLVDTNPYEAGAFGQIAQSGGVLQLIADSGNTSSHGSIFFYSYNDNDTLNAYRIADNYHIWYTAGASNSEKMRLNDNGKLGIGTNTPESKLTVFSTDRHVQQLMSENGVTAGTTSGTIYRQQYTSAATSRRMGFFGIKRDGGSGDQRASFVMELCPDNSTNLGLGSPASNTTAFEFKRTGVMKVKDGGGIQFHNYGTGTNIDNNLLDDYEEGTFTPHFEIETRGAGDSPVDGVQGRYVKVGNVVTCHYMISLDGTPSERSTNRAWEIHGFPFQSKSGNSSGQMGGSQRVTGYETATYGPDGYFVFRLFNNNTFGRLEFIESNYNGTRNASPMMQNNAQVIGTITYQTSG